MVDPASALAIGAVTVAALPANQRQQVQSAVGNLAYGIRRLAEAVFNLPANAVHWGKAKCGDFRVLSEIKTDPKQALLAKPVRARLRDLVNYYKTALVPDEPHPVGYTLPTTPEHFRVLIEGLESLGERDLPREIFREKENLLAELRLSEESIPRSLIERVIEFFSTHLESKPLGIRTDLLEGMQHLSLALAAGLTTTHHDPAYPENMVQALVPFQHNPIFGQQANAIADRIRENNRVDVEDVILVRRFLGTLLDAFKMDAPLAGEALTQVKSYIEQAEASVQRMYATLRQTVSTERPPEGIETLQNILVNVCDTLKTYTLTPLIPTNLEAQKAQLQTQLEGLQECDEHLEDPRVTLEMRAKIAAVKAALIAYLDPTESTPLPSISLFTAARDELQIFIGYKAARGPMAALMNVAATASGIRDTVMGYVETVTEFIGDKYEQVDHPLVTLYHAAQSIRTKGDAVTDELNAALDAVDPHIPGFSHKVRLKLAEHLPEAYEEPPLAWAQRMIATDHKKLLAAINHCLKEAWDNDVINESGPINAQALNDELQAEVTRFAKMAKPSLGGPGFGAANVFSKDNPHWTILAFASLQNRRRNVTEEAPIKLYDAIQRGLPALELEAAMAALDSDAQGSFAREVETELFKTHMSLDHRLTIWGEAHLGEIPLEDFTETYNRSLKLLGVRFKMSDQFKHDDAQTAAKRMKILRDREASVPGIFTLFLSLLRENDWGMEAQTLDPYNPSFRSEWTALMQMYAPGLELDPVESWKTGFDAFSGIKDLDRTHPGLLAASMARLLPPTEEELTWMKAHLADSREDLLHAAKVVLVQRSQEAGDMDALRECGRQLLQQDSEEYEAQGGVLDPLKPHHTFEALAYLSHQKNDRTRFGNLPILPMTESTKAPTLGLFTSASSSMFSTLLRSAERFAGGHIQPWVDKGKQYAREFIEKRLRPFATGEKGILTEAEKAKLNSAITASLQDLDAIRPGNLGDLKRMIESVRRRTSQFDVHINGHALPLFGRGSAHRVKGADFVQQEILRTQRLQDQLARNPGDSPEADWRLKLDKEILNMAAVTACKTLHQIVWGQFIGSVDNRKALEKEWHQDRPDLQKGTTEYDDYIREQKARNSEAYYGRPVDQSFTEIMARVSRQGDLTPDEQYDAFYKELKKEISARDDTGWKGYLVGPIMWATTLGTHKVIKTALKQGLETLRTGIQSWKIENAGADGQHRPMPLTIINQIAGFFAEFNLVKKREDALYGGDAPLSQISRSMERPVHNLGLTQEQVDEHLTKAAGNMFLPTITVWPIVDEWWDACGAFVKANATESTAGIAKLGNKIAGVFQYLIGGVWAGLLTIVSIGRASFQFGANFMIKRIFNHGMKFFDAMGQIEETIGSSLWSGEQYTVAMQESIRDLLKLALEALQDESGGESMDIDAIAAQQPQWVQDAIAESVTALSNTFINHIFDEAQLKALGELFGSGKLAVGIAADQAIKLAVKNIVKFIVVGYFVAQQDDKMEEVLCKLVTNLQTAMIGEIGDEADGTANLTSMGNRCAAVKVDISNLLQKVGEVSIHKGVKSLLTDGDTDFKARAGYAKGFLEADLLKQGTMTRNAEKRRIRPNATQGRIEDWSEQLKTLAEPDTADAVVLATADALTRSTLGFSEEFTKVVDHVERNSPSASAKDRVMESLAHFRADFSAFRTEVGAINNLAISDQDTKAVLAPTKAVIRGLRLIQESAEVISNAQFAKTEHTIAHLAQIETLEASIALQLDGLESKERSPSFGANFQQLQLLHRKMTKAALTLKRAVELTEVEAKIQDKVTNLAAKKVTVLQANESGGVLARAFSFFSDGMAEVRKAQHELDKELITVPTLTKRLIQKHVEEIVTTSTEGRVQELVASIMEKTAESSTIAKDAADEARAQFTVENEALLPDVTAFLAELETPAPVFAPESLTMPQRANRALTLIERMRRQIEAMEVPSSIGFNPVDPDLPSVKAAEQTILNLSKSQVENLLELMLSPHMIKNLTRRLGKLSVLESLMPASEYAKITRMSDEEAALRKS